MVAVCGVRRRPLRRISASTRARSSTGERDALIKKIARVKHERVAGGLPTYRPVATFAWREKESLLTIA